MAEKQIQGRLNKFFEEIVLVDQLFVVSELCPLREQVPEPGCACRSRIRTSLASRSLLRRCWRRSASSSTTRSPSLATRATQVGPSAHLSARDPEDFVERLQSARALPRTRTRSASRKRWRRR